MPTTADPTLKTKLTAIEREIGELREKRAVKVRDRDRTRDAFAKTAMTDPNSREFKAAMAEVDAVADLDNKIDAAKLSQIGVLKMIGVSGAGVDGEFNGNDGREIERIKSTPGALLAAILDRRKHEVPSLREDIRTKALTVGANISTTTESTGFIDLLSPASVVLESGVGRIDLTTTKIDIPRFTSLPVAAWVLERGIIPSSDPGLVMAESEPTKAGLVTTLSTELFEDLSPAVLAGVQLQLMRAVALTLDAGLLNGTGIDPQPLGIMKTVGAIAIAGGVTNLSAFADAVGALVAANASPDTIVITPATFRTLLLVMEEAGSNVPLVPAAGGQGFAVKYFPGIRWFISAGVAAGKAVVYDSKVVTAIIRHPVDLAVDPFAGFSTGEVGLRSYVRADVIVGQPTGVAVVTLT